MIPATGLFGFLALAFWFGILTSISPCPLTTNIAAMSFIIRNLSSRDKNGSRAGESASESGSESATATRSEPACTPVCLPSDSLTDGNTFQSIISGLLYTLGRVTAYLLLGFVTVKGLVSIPGISVFLQNYANKVLGLLLIFVGMFLLELITFDWSISAGADKLQGRVKGGGIHWSFILGFIFALSFCPPSAAIFFGSVIPLAIKGNSLVLVPLAYGLGTGLPVMLFAVAILKGATTLGRYFSMVQSLERYLRQITGYIFITAGIYLTLVYVYKVL